MLNILGCLLGFIDSILTYSEMKLVKEKIVFARALIREADDSFYHAGSFIDLQSRICVGVHSNLELATPYQLLIHITQDIWNIETLVFRLNWQKELFSGNQLNKILWMQFAACDIDLFHVELRSVFDYLAKLILFFTVKSGEVDTKMSFRELQQWLTRNRGNAKRLGVDLANVVADCDWFVVLRDVPDSIVHRGGSVIFFQSKAEFCSK